jgi:integrase
MDRSLIGEFQLDWKLSGKSAQTAKNYADHLLELLENSPDPMLSDVKVWLGGITSTVGRRKRGQAVRAFGKWSEANGYGVFPWWANVPLAREQHRPQETVTFSDYQLALRQARHQRDKVLIEVLWSTGLRRSEVARLDVADINLADGFLIVRSSKNGRPRTVPLTAPARHGLRRWIGKRTSGSVFGLTSNGIRLVLRRINAPSAHAWRRGWAVQALKNGVSETSVRSAAGWSSGAMVARYVNALSSELAIHEFHSREVQKG